MRYVAILVAAMVCFTPVRADDHEDEVNAAFAKNKSDQYASETFSKVMPYKVGQWVLYGQTDDDGDRSLYKMSIVGQKGDTWILETWMMNEDDIIIMQMHVKGMQKALDTRSTDDLEFEKIKMKNNDSEAMTIEGFVLSMSASAHKAAMESWIQQNTQFTDGGPLTVPGGAFAGTTKAKSTVIIMGDDIESTGYLHPAIPIYGMVKSENDDGYSMVLLDFGLEGAKPSI